MKVLIVTGVPGTGKTIIAKKLSNKFNYFYVDVNNLISKNKLAIGYDRKRRTKIVDIKKLNQKLIEEIRFFKNVLENKNKKIQSAFGKIYSRHIGVTSIKNKKFNGIIIDSHLSHYLPKKYVDLCIVTKCDIKELNKRLKKRKYPKNKIQENLQAEIFDVCYNEALERKHKVLVIDTTKSFNMSKILSLINK